MKGRTIMKKTLALLLALVMMLGLAACGSSSTTATTETTTETATEAADAAPAEEGGVQTVGISMPTKSLERWNRDGSYLQEQFEAAGFNVLLTYSDNDTTKQNSDIDNMLAEDIDLLIVAAIDGEALSQSLASAKEQGIPVIAYDRMITNSDAVDYYVSFDNYTVGVLQAQYVIDALDLDNAGDKTYNIEFTGGDPADNNATFFFNGAFDTLKPYIEAGTLNIPSGKTTFEQVGTPQWSTDTALENFQNTLASYYSDGTILDIALCSNDSTALGVAQAITSDYAGSNTPLVTGQDGDIANLKNIVDGVQTMTVYKNVADEAGVTLVLAQALLNGDTIDETLCEKFAVEAAYNTTDYSNGTNVATSFLLVPYSIDANNLQLLVDTGNYVWDADNKYLEIPA
jgi:ABC-type xylose transport system substrate-binding protein